MSVNKEDTLRQFCDVTGADDARSRFFLESANWQLEVALSSFYEHGGNVDDAPANPTPAVASLPTLSDSDMESPPASPLHVQKKDKKKQANTKFATLQSLHCASSSEEDEGQAFYAGGSERSGQQILGPGKGRKDIVTEMFKSVREQGAVVFDNEPTSSGRGRGAFSGAGYRLGQTADDHEQVTPGGNSQQQEQSRSVRLRLYREGFTVDSGPIRAYTDPENMEFLSSIRRGEIPSELSRGRWRGASQFRGPSARRVSSRYFVQTTSFYWKGAYTWKSHACDRGRDGPCGRLRRRSCSQSEGGATSCRPGRGRTRHHYPVSLSRWQSANGSLQPHSHSRRFAAIRVESRARLPIAVVRSAHHIPQC
ncbi:unnamed protein product [Parnassius apollo]|uniref:(apollo) hypothetical protein n=1 Tax=Parnassius apollo TaxID=110799 RepID=A0A8S3X0Q7_PARAO|nr:unnamed protein product [Parnassius apollo]